MKRRRAGLSDRTSLQSLALTSSHRKKEQRNHQGEVAAKLQLEKVRARKGVHAQALRRALRNRLRKRRQRRGRRKLAARRRAPRKNLLVRKVLPNREGAAGAESESSEIRDLSSLTEGSF